MAETFLWCGYENKAVLADLVRLQYCRKITWLLSVCWVAGVMQCEIDPFNNVVRHSAGSQSLIKASLSDRSGTGKTLAHSAVLSMKSPRDFWIKCCAR